MFGWLGRVALIVVGIAGVVGLICLIGGWRTMVSYGFALAWIGLAIGLLGALAE